MVESFINVSPISISLIVEAILPACFCLECAFNRAKIGGREYLSFVWLFDWVEEFSMIRHAFRGINGESFNE
jgi:hypothetical protein